MANLSKILSSAPNASQRPFHLATMQSNDQSTIKNVPVTCFHFSCIFDILWPVEMFPACITHTGTTL